MKKKVLVITYYWPPAGGIGVLRCLKFVKHLREFGWEPIVYVPQKAQYPSFDDWNVKDIPKNLTILQHPILEPFNLFKILSGRGKESAITNPIFVRDRKKKFFDTIAIWIRGNFFIPDARSLWIKPSVRFLSKYIDHNGIHAIFSDGPPHTNTVIACNLSQKFDIPWLADFQDPWSQVDYYEHLKLTRWADRKHKRMEQEVFRIAKKITIVSPSWKKNIEMIGAQNVEVLYWGYDDDDFTNLTLIEENKFVITHNGLLGLDRDPETFFKVIKKMVLNDKDFKSKLCIKLIGMVDYGVVDVINKLNLNKFVILTGNVPRSQSINHLFNSNILLLLLNKAKNSRGRIPGKLFEYLRINKPILCLGQTDSDSANLVIRTERGEVYEYDDAHGIENCIKSIFSNYREKKFEPSSVNISQYSVKNQTRILSTYLNEISKE